MSTNPPKNKTTLLDFHFIYRNNDYSITIKNNQITVFNIENSTGMWNEIYCWTICDVIMINDSAVLELLEMTDRFDIIYNNKNKSYNVSLKIIEQLKLL